MNKYIPVPSFFKHRFNQETIQCFCLLVVLVSLFSCGQKMDRPKDLKETIPHTLSATPAELPPPIKARYLDPDSILVPTVIPLKKPPKVVQAHSNVHPVGTPMVVPIPKNIIGTTLGENGVPEPIIIPAKKKTVRALQPKPIAALASDYRDVSIYDINYLSDNQGLPVGGQAFLEDTRGNIWFGGYGGIVRYDGKHFFHYTKKEGFLDIVWSVMEDSKGNIWITGERGICSYDGQNVIHYTIDEEENDGLKLFGCSVQMEDSKGNIWFTNYGFGTDGSGVYRFDGQNFTVFEKEYWIDKNDYGKEPRHVYEYAVNTILEDSRGHFWWGTLGSGVLRYDGQSITHYTTKEGLIGNYISTILEDSKGRIWLGTDEAEPNRKGVGCYTPQPTSPLGIGGTFTNFTQKEGISDGSITGMIEDKSGNLWFSTFKGGINRYDGKSFTHFKAEEGLVASILSIMEDSKGNIWTGTNGANGPWAAISDAVVNRFQPHSFVHFTEKLGLTKPTVSTIKEDSKGNLWIGTYEGGVIKYDGQTFTHYTKEQGLCDNEIYFIMEDSRGDLWFATKNEGVSRFDGKVFTNYTIGQGLSFDLVWYMHEDNLGRIWFACSILGGIIRLDPETGQFTHFSDGSTVRIRGANIGIGGSGIMEDSQHNLWFGAAGWVAKYDSGKDQINYVYQIDSLNKEWIDYMLEDDKGNLWFGSESRLVKVNSEVADNEDNKFTLFTKGNGLPDFKIQSIVEDKQKNIWISSNKGLAVMIGGLENIEIAKWIQYNKADGLKSSGYMVSSAYLDSKNRMWWGTATTGLTMLDLNAFSLPTQAPENVSLSHIEINQQFLDYRNLASQEYSNTLAFGEIIKETVDSVVSFQNYPTTLNLPFDLNHLTFHFSAIDWDAPHKIQYSYQMEGLDEEWSNLQYTTEANYRNLPYGTYTFKVKAIGEAQVWSEPFSYTFTIRPPWWHTWWAYALYVLLAVGASGWYIQSLRRKIQQKQEQLDRELNLNEELAVTNQQLADINVANSRFVPKDFLHILGKDSLLDLQLGDQTEATMTILFADIRSYTALSETMNPEDNFNFINGFLGRMGPIVKDHGGFINQYLGDGIMALFKNEHEMAVKAAIEMQQALERYNKKRSVQNRKAIRLGIGLNTGQLMLGVIGDKGRYESSVISDAVNTASRMEGLTKIFGCSIIISEKTLAEIHLLDSKEVSDAFLDEYRYLGKVKVKGKDQALKIYDFYRGDSAHFRQMKSATKVSFERAIHFYYHRKFGKAADILKEIAQKFPEDIATEYYLEKAVEYTVKGVAPDWSGVEEMVSK